MKDKIVMILFNFFLSELAYDLCIREYIHETTEQIEQTFFVT